MTKTDNRATKAVPADRRKTLLWVFGGLLGLALIVGLAVAIATEEPVDASIGFGEVEVSGALLPPSGTLPDPAIGQTAPTITGADWDGNEVTIAPDGDPKLVVFLAHWCPHCQNEVPVVQDWVDAGNLPDGVKLVAVSTLTDRRRPNWPPQNWLVRESWSSPVIMDNNINAVSAAFGMAGTPFWVALDGNNRVLARVAGEIGVDGIAQLAGLAAASLVD